MNKIIFVQKVIVLHPGDKNKFLLLKRHGKDTSRPGDIDIPGGRARFNETHEHAILREVREETGLEIEDIKPIIVNSRLQTQENLYFLYIGYTAMAKTDTVSLNAEEHESYSWEDVETFVKENPQHILTEQIKKLL